MSPLKSLLLASLSLLMLFSCSQAPSGDSPIKESSPKLDETNIPQAYDQVTTEADSRLGTAEAKLVNRSPKESSALLRKKGPQFAGTAEIESLYQALKDGGEVKLQNLIYYLESPLVISGKNDFTLDGNGCTFIMKNKSENVLFVEGNKNVTLKNFKATHVEPEGPIGCTGSVIYVGSNDGVLIENCELNGSGIIGVVAYDTRNLQVVGNYIYNNSEYGVLFNVGTSVEIKGNKFEDNGKSGEDHVAKALDDGISEVEAIKGNQNKKGLKMSDNLFSKGTQGPEQAVAGEEEVAALYRAIENGTDVKLQNLIYYLERPLRISKQNGFTLDGNGGTFIMKDKNEDVVIVKQSTNITLRGFKATHIEPEGPIGCTGSVIKVEGNNGVLIEKCELNGSGIIGVMAYQTVNLKVLENYIYNNSRYGILYDKDCTVEIKGNKFEDNGRDGNDHVAMALNDYLSEVKRIEKGGKTEGVEMSDNIFK